MASMECRLSTIPLSVLGHRKVPDEYAISNKKLGRDGLVITGTLPTLLSKNVFTQSLMLT